MTSDIVHEPSPNTSEREALWQPIETAPRDGTPVLLWLDPPLETSYLCGWMPMRELRIVVGWAEGFGAYADRTYCRWECGLCEEGSADTEGYSSAIAIGVTPTHWQQLPGPPVASTPGGGATK